MANISKSVLVLKVYKKTRVIGLDELETARSHSNTKRRSLTFVSASPSRSSPEPFTLLIYRRMYSYQQIFYRQSPTEDMVSHENEVMILLGVAAVILLASISTFTNLPTWISIAVVVVVGVLIPQFISREDE